MRGKNLEIGGNRQLLEDDLSVRNRREWSVYEAGDGDSKIIEGSFTRPLDESETDKRHEEETGELNLEFFSNRGIYLAVELGGKMKLHTIAHDAKGAYPTIEVKSLKEAVQVAKKLDQAMFEAVNKVANEYK